MIHYSMLNSEQFSFFGEVYRKKEVDFPPIYLFIDEQYTIYIHYVNV